MSEPIAGFPPIARNDARILILGSMPSEESLKKQQYYAHPRNGFWPIMLTLLGQPTDLSYARRRKLLIDNHIALWDTLKTCVRSGSLDSAIVDHSIETNDFNTFFARHRRIHAVFFNGQKSQQVYKKLVVPELSEAARQLKQYVLPSTSPAMASLNQEQKLHQWQIILDKLEIGATV